MLDKQEEGRAHLSGANEWFRKDIAGRRAPRAEGRCIYKKKGQSPGGVEKVLIAGFRSEKKKKSREEKIRKEM